MLPSFENTEVAFRYKSTAELKKAQFLFGTMNFPTISSIGMKFTAWAFKVGLPIKSAVKSTIFQQFCGGENLKEAAATAQKLARYNMGIILDYSVEGKEDEADFDNAVIEFTKATEYAASEKNIPFVSVKITGYARFALLEKIHAQEKLSATEEQEWQRVIERIDKVCAAGDKHNIMVLIDAEETWIQHAVNILAEGMMEKYNKQKALVYNTYQMYCHASLEWLKNSQKEAVQKGYILGAKLVRGAYMEKERERAQAMGYPSPIQPDKAATDRDYDAGTLFCLENLDTLSLFIGSHNENSCFQAAQYMEQHNIPHNTPKVFFSQLFGMSDNISFNLADAGYNVAKYMPYGPVKDVIPYLMRRAQENTSVAGQTGKELTLINTELKRRNS
jgi:proline dehydrogenase